MITDYLKRYPFAEKYIFSPNELNIMSLPNYIRKKLLKEISPEDIKFLDTLLRWKELVIQGYDVPCPIDKMEFKPKAVRDSKLLLLWKVTEYICVGLFVPILIIIGIFIWGNLEIKQDYHILIIIAIIIIISLIVRLLIHITLIRNIKIFEQLFPYAAIQSKIASQSDAYNLLRSLTDSCYYNRYAQFFKPNFSHYIRLNTFISTFYELIKNAISTYPDKILLYYKYGENNSCVFQYKETKNVENIFRVKTERTAYSYINIYDILLDIDKEQNLQFLLSVISHSKINKIKVTKLNAELESNYNLLKDYLLIEGEFFFHLNKWVDKDVFKISDTYQFRRDKFFRKYAIILSILGIILLGYYPTYFRWNYVRNQLAKNKYEKLIEDYDANREILYNLETVNLIATVHNNRVYNNHVGDSWGCHNYVNETYVHNNKSHISYHYGDQIILKTEIVEYDNIRDVSSQVNIFNFSKEELIKGVDISIDSYVYENRGRYSGCHAKWISKYHIEVEKPNKPIYQNIEVAPTEIIKNFFISVK